MKLSKRLLAVAKLVPTGAVVMDIGTDHGYLPLYLLSSKHCDKVYGTDLREGPLSSAAENGQQFLVKKQLILMIQDGLLPIPSDVNCITISGLGGTLMAEMFQQDKVNLNSITKIIVQPQGHSERIRSVLNNLGFMISNETMILENKLFYEVIEFTKGIQSLTENELLFGPCLLSEKSADFIARWKQEKDYLEKVAAGIPVDSVRYNEILEVIQRIRGIL